MSCVLRISGTALDIDALLSSVTLAPNRVWRKGELRSKAVARTHVDSGASFVASDAEFDAFDQQIADAIAFLSSNSAAVAALASFPGVEQATLDFGVALFEGNFATFSCLPPSLVQLAAQAKLGIEISTYACDTRQRTEG